MFKKRVPKSWLWILCVLFVSGFFQVAMAIDIYWNGAGDAFDGLSGDDGDFRTMQNWSPVRVPDDDDSAWFDLSSTYRVFFSRDHASINGYIQRGKVTLRGTHVYTLSGDMTISSYLTLFDGLDLSVGDDLNLQAWTMEINSGSDVTANDLLVASSGNATIDVDGGTLTVDATTRIGSSGGYTGTINIDNGGSADFIGTLNLGGEILSGQQGHLNIYGGSSVTANRIDIGTSGLSGCLGQILIDGADSILETGDSRSINIGASGTSTGNMTIGDSGEFASGESNKIVVNATGSIINKGSFTLNGDLTVNGGLQSSRVVAVTNYEQGPGGTLRLDIGYEIPAPYFGVIDATDSIDLEGELEVGLIGIYVPDNGDSFDLFNWSGMLTGTFSTVSLPDISAHGLAWDTSDLYTTGEVHVVPRRFTIHVDDDNAGFEDGSAAHPYNTIQEGIDASYLGDTVQVAEGTYSESIILKNGVSIIGAGPEVTTIDGNYQASGVTVVLAENLNQMTRIEGFNISGGNQTFAAGGIHCSNSSIVLDNCIIAQNAGTSIDGGGMACINSTVAILNSIFRDNWTHVSGDGGGFSAVASNVIISDSTFEHNNAVSKGGAINSESSTITLSNCTFIENTGHWKGGAIYNEAGSTLNATDCTYYGNSAVTSVISGGSGGAIYNEGNIHLVQCKFIQNIAEEFEDSDFDLHGGDGGGVCNQSDATNTITNCLFLENVAGREIDPTSIWHPEGGAIYTSGAGSLSVYNSTFANNITGGAQNYYQIYVYSSDFNLINSIIDNDNHSHAIANIAGPISIQYSNIYSQSYTVQDPGNLNADPLFFIDTSDPSPSNWSVTLQPGSPCIDAGNNTAVPPGIETDLSGGLRFIDDPFTIDSGNGTAPIVDMGAYEHYQPIECVADFDGDGDVDGKDLSEYIHNPSGIDLERFTFEYGGINCQ